VVPLQCCSQSGPPEWVKLQLLLPPLLEEFPESQFMVQLLMKSKKYLWTNNNTMTTVLRSCTCIEKEATATCRHYTDWRFVKLHIFTTNNTPQPGYTSRDGGTPAGAQGLMEAMLQRHQVGCVTRPQLSQ